MLNTEIIIKEKPESVSWDEIHSVLYSAHKPNRELGIYQATAELSGKRLREVIGDGKCFVALDGDRVIGTCSVKIKNPHRWFAHGKAAYYMLAGVLPEYQGRGIYSLLDQARDKYVVEQGIRVIYTFTPEKNIKLQTLRLKKGYYLAGFIAPSKLDYYSVILVKWQNPPALIYIKLRYFLSKTCTLIKHRRKS